MEQNQLVALLNRLRKEPIETEWLEFKANRYDGQQNCTMRFKHDTLTVQCIYPKQSKPILDEIDTVLAGHYGFTAEELDFILNYDIKYRLGRGAESEEDR